SGSGALRRRRSETSWSPIQPVRRALPTCASARNRDLWEKPPRGARRARRWRRWLHSALPPRGLKPKTEKNALSQRWKRRTTQKRVFTASFQSEFSKRVFSKLLSQGARVAALPEA